MKLLGLIPARAGSKRVPGKNMVDLGGKPLIQWTIEAALASCEFDAVAVSSEDRDIQNFAYRCGCRLIIRPQYLATDDATSLSVVLHAIDWMPRFDAVVLLQPTSPFRTIGNIKEAVQTFGQYANDSLVSVRPDGEVNGAIYITRVKALLAGAPLYDEKSIRFYMGQEPSFDIDTPQDLEYARGMMAAARGEHSANDQT